jgi:ADP-dependent NAD(P)H-hydrate dehydratase / NAD(P)H-hydrate epimerase
MKILSVEQIREADSYTIKNEPITDIDLMERASTACASWIAENVPGKKKIKVFCGTGNNGGDGMAIARILKSKGYITEAYLAGDPLKMSASCKINYDCLVASEESKPLILSDAGALPSIDDGNDVIIDALFGSGLTREITGFQSIIINHINQSKALIISIDMPSGLFCDSTVTAIRNPSVIHADYTLTFAPPKLALFFPENDTFAGNWKLLDIGIMKDYLDSVETKYFYPEEDDFRKILRPRGKFTHKGNYGHALLICGSLGKMGAAVLSARACLRSGPGLVTVHIPRSGNCILQTAVPEAMLDLDEDPDVFSNVPDLNKYSSIAIGPGTGTDTRTQQALKLLIQNSGSPLIFDADAINILGENKTWLSFVPKQSIYTPHPKEFERLAGKSVNDYDRNQKQREFSVKYGVYVILKGAYTAVTTPEGLCYFNPTGNPGMATGGSGDVLTGIIAGLKAQGYSSLESSLLGVYLHGLAGDQAAGKKGFESLIASDITDHLGTSFLKLYG